MTRLPAWRRIILAAGVVGAVVVLAVVWLVASSGDDADAAVPVRSGATSTVSACSPPACVWWLAPDRDHLWQLGRGHPGDAPRVHDVVGVEVLVAEPVELSPSETGGRRLVPTWLIVLVGVFVVVKVVAPMVSGRPGMHG